MIYSNVIHKLARSVYRLFHAAQENSRLNDQFYDEWWCLIITLCENIYEFIRCFHTLIVWRDLCINSIIWSIDTTLLIISLTCRRFHRVRKLNISLFVSRFQFGNILIPFFGSTLYAAPSLSCFHLRPDRDMPAEAERI